jgi:hypothetical protein
VKHRMDQEYDLVESIELLLAETAIENPNIDIGVKDYFFQQTLHLAASGLAGVHDAYGGCNVIGGQILLRDRRVAAVSKL